MAILAELAADLAWYQLPIVPLAIGGLGLYLAARLGTAAVVGSKGAAGATAGEIAIAHAVPTAAVSIMAMIGGRPDVAVSITFATSVAAVLLALGMSVFVSPGAALPDTRRAWPALLPAALLLFVAGLGGSLGVAHAVMLAVLGLLVGSVWKQAPATASSEGEGTTAEGYPSTGTSSENSATAMQGAGDPEFATADDRSNGGVAVLSYRGPSRRTADGRWILPLAAIGLAVVAARAAVIGLVYADETSPTLRAGVVGTCVLAPLLVLPLLAIGTDLAQRGRSGQACGGCVGLALLNLLGLLPILILLQAALAGFGWNALASGQTWSIVDWYRTLATVPLPISVWRIDTVILAVVAMLLMPAALGRGRLGRSEALLLIGGYAAYLAVSAYLVVRR